MALKPPPPLKPTVQRFYGMERPRQVGLPTPDQVKYETSLQAFLSSLPTQAGAGMVSVAAPPSMSTPVYLMLGLHLVINTNVAERALLMVSGNVANSVSGGETDLQFYYGTGTPPIAGAAATGTATGSQMRYQASTGGAWGPFSKSVLVTGLTPGASYWFDLAMRAPSGVGSVSNLDVTAFGLN